MSKPTKKNANVDDVLLSRRDPPEYYIAILNRQIKDGMDAALRPHDLKLVDWRILQSLELEMPLSICDLSKRTVIERTITSRLVDQLVSRGLVEKKPMGTDRRFSLVSLTDAGMAKLDETSPSVDAVRSKLFHGFSIREHQTLVRLLKNIVSNGYQHLPV